MSACNCAYNVPCCACCPMRQNMYIPINPYYQYPYWYFTPTVTTGTITVPGKTNCWTITTYVSNEATPGSYRMIDNED